MSDKSIYHSKTLAKDFFQQEMLEKLKSVMPQTPIELVGPIYDYWSSSAKMAKKAAELINR